MSSEWNDLERRLESLGSAVSDGGMPGPGAARQRAKQRSRRHATSAALGTALVLAGGTFAVAQLSGTPADVAPIAPTDTTPSPTEETDGLADELMTVDDIDDDTYEWRLADEDRPECYPAIGIDEMASRSQVTYETDSTPLVDHASHDVYLIEPGAAASVFELLAEQTSDCERATHQSMGPLHNVGDEGYLVQYAFGDEGSLDLVVEFSVIRQDDVLSVVTLWWEFPGPPGDPDLVTPANAANRMCAALFGDTCVDGDPAFEPIEGDGNDGTEPNDTEPVEPDPNEAGTRTLTGDYLTADQLNLVGDRDPFVQGSLSEDGAPSWESLCMDDPGQQDLATGIEAWTDFNDASLFQVGLEFTDAGAADQWLRGYTAIEDRCATFDIAGQDGTVVDEQLLDLPSGEDALVWSVFYSPPDAGTAFHGAGMARRDNIVVMLIYGAMDGPEGPGDWVGYVHERLEPLLDRAAS